MAHQSFLFVTLSLVLAVSSNAEAATKATSYQTTTSEIRYRVHHLLKTSEGTSHEARGKVVCVDFDANCQFLFAVATATFDSGNSNRDAHMKQTVKEALHPLATVRGTIAKLETQKMLPTLSVDFAGKTVSYPLKTLTVLKKDEQIEIAAELVLKLSSHDIERPSLLGASIDDEVPVSIKMKLALIR